MKKSIAVAAVVAFALSVVPAYAGNTVSVPMSATVAPQLELAATVFEGNVGGPEAATIDFGSLVSDTPNGPLRGESFYTVLLTANSSSRQYQITQTASALTNGTTEIEDGASIVTPHSNGVTLPAGSQLGTRGSFVATDKPLYTSETAGSMQSIAAAYAVTSDAAQGATEIIPSDKQGGNYTSNVTFTLTLV